jgi:hypothetical protein
VPVRTRFKKGFKASFLLEELIFIEPGYVNVMKAGNADYPKGVNL